MLGGSEGRRRWSGRFQEWLLLGGHMSKVGKEMMLTKKKMIMFKKHVMLTKKLRLTEKSMVRI